MLIVTTIPIANCKGTKPQVILPQGSWVAGGAVRRWYMGEPQDADYDVFTTGEEATQAFLKANGLSEFDGLTAPMGFATNYGVVSVNKHHFPNIREVLDYFDFTICQFLWDGGPVIKVNRRAIRDAEKKRLVVHNLRLDTILSSMWRISKYGLQGYRISFGELKKIATAIRTMPQATYDKNGIFPSGGY